MKISLFGSLIGAGFILVMFGLNPSLAGDDDPASLSAKDCIVDKSSDFGQDGKQFVFTMNFENNCDKPIACTIDAYIVGFRGPTSAHTILRFPAKAQTPAQKTYVVKVKAAGGQGNRVKMCVTKD